ncbi:MAG: hypothetical protein RIC51_08025 [Erythrobacter sp.]|uniref:hypothetical protein n=1 Tax=Erythrobacter sp. TaxID=1042 RepID=UPI0032EAC145
MKVTPFAVLLLALAAVQPAFAEDAPAEAAPVADALTIDTPIEVLMADDRAKAVLETHLPGIGGHPSYDSFKAMSLVQLMPWSQGMITDETLANIGADLAALEAAPTA